MLTAHEKRVRMKELMLAEECVPLPGAYDVISARVIEETGFHAAYVGSYCTAASLYGFPDVGSLSMQEMVFHARNIARAIDIPLICDAENGFTHAANIWRTIEAYEDAGTAGIHIEDHEFGKHTDLQPRLLSAEEMCRKIRAACDAKKDKDFLIFARTDAAWATKDMEEAVRRANMYLEAGADAAFLATGGFPITKQVREKIHGPVVKTVGRMSLKEETECGFNLSIYWPMALYAALIACKEACQALKETEDYYKLGKYVFDEPAFNHYVRFDEFKERVKKFL